MPHLTQNFFNQDMTVATGAASGVDRLQALQALNARMVCMTVDESSYDEVVSGVSKVIGCDYCSLFLKDPHSEELVLQAAVSTDGIEAGLRISCDDPSSIHAQAFSEEYQVHLDDLTVTPGINPLAEDMGCSLVVPVISNAGPVGVFDFSYCEPGAFTQDRIGMCTMIVDQMSYSLENIRLVNELRDSRDAVIRGMAMLSEIRDSHIGGHLSRICAMSRYLAQRLVDRVGYHSVTPAFIDIIERAAALHDVGKVGVPDSILLKPGKLTDDEFDVMRTHTTIGGELLEDLIDDFGQYAMITMGAIVARCHHERWDGLGYPKGLSGKSIPLEARIVSICDVYDALTSRRVYKEAWSHEDTIQVLRDGAGTQFDPDLVSVFISRPKDLIQIRNKYPDKEKTAESVSKISL
ncbi:MAG: HD domain-containing protein [bacterium]|nr:HD domain-containing protein [bacterium]